MAVIGRDASADIVLPFPQVSGRHAVLEPAGEGRFRVRDLDSANGVFVNRNRVKEGFVKPGDDLRFGSVQFDWTAHLPRLEAEAQKPAGILVGRDPACQIVISDVRVSARHLKVVPLGGQLDVTDLGSGNGFSVNGTEVSSAVVSPGDAVRLGTLSVNLFELLARPPQAEKPLARYVPRPSDRAGAGPSNPPASRSLLARFWPAIVLGILLGGAAAAFGTRQVVRKSCEIAGCGEELYARKLFAWQVADARRDASALRWCTRHANEPVTVNRKVLCEICGLEIKTEKIQVARKDNPHDVVVQRGVHDRCLAERVAGGGGKSVKTSGPPASGPPAR